MIVCFANSFATAITQCLHREHRLCTGTSLSLFASCGIDYPGSPAFLSNYLTGGLPKRDTATPEDIATFVGELVASRRQLVEPAELPETAEPIKDPDTTGDGTVVKEKVKCGNDSCACADGEPAAMHRRYLYRYY